MSVEPEAFNLVRKLGFMATMDRIDDARVVLFGVPMDFTVSARPGSRFGPSRIREVSDILEEYSPALDAELEEARFYDAGDVMVPFGNVALSLAMTARAVGALLDAGKVPVMMGGEHLVTLPCVEQVKSRNARLAVVQFDAHADLREDYMGETASHATVMRRICEAVGPENVFQFGIRSGTREEWAYARANTRIYPGRPGELASSVKEALPELEGRPVYVSVDIDVVDPAFAPGTGTPEPGGSTSSALMEAVGMLLGLDLVGLDVVEVLPAYDLGDRTALLAAKLIREAVIGIGARRR